MFRLNWGIFFLIYKATSLNILYFSVYYPHIEYYREVEILTQPVVYYLYTTCFIAKIFYITNNILRTNSDYLANINSVFSRLNILKLKEITECKSYTHHMVWNPQIISKKLSVNLISGRLIHFSCILDYTLSNQIYIHISMCLQDPIFPIENLTES